MAISDINLSGKVRADNGDGVSGASVTILETSAALTGALEGSAVTTNSDGTWSFTEQTLTETYDVKITSDGGGQIRYIPWSDEITLKTVDTSVLKVRGVASAAAPLYFFADRADDAGDGWRIQASTSDTLAIGSNKANASTIIDYITITNGANAAASTVTIAGTLDVNGSVDWDVTDVQVDSSGDIDLVSTSNAAAAIYLQENGGTSGTIKIHADQGTSESSIQLLSDAGGVDINAATGKDVDIAGGTVNLTSSDNAASAIYLRANAGTSETIKIHADQGTGAASISAVSDVGGITLDAGLDIVLSADGGNITMDDGTATIFDFNVDDTSLTIHDDQDTGDKAVITVAQHGALSIVTTDDDAAAANIQLTADGTVDIDAAGAINLDSGSGVITFEDSGTEVLRLTEGNSGDVTVKLVTNGKDLVFTDNGDATNMKILDAAAGINVPGEVQTTGIGYTDGDNSMTIADGGKVTFAAGFAVGSDAAGDVLYHNGTSYIRLAKGDDDQVLTLASGVPSWAAAGSGSVSAVANGANNRITTFSSSDALNGEANLTFDGSALQVTGTVTVGSDGSGSDVIFYSGTSGDNLTWDSSEEVLQITGTNGATALDVLDGDVRVVDTLYFYDRGGEYMSSDGSTLAIVGNTSVAGNLLPSADDSYDLGSASAAWQDLFIEGDITLTDAGSIVTSAGSLTLDPATTLVINPDGMSQAYAFTQPGSEVNIALQAQSSGQFSGFYLLTADGDGTDYLNMGIVATGTPDSFSNLEYCFLGFDPSDNTISGGTFRLLVAKAGSGTAEFPMAFVQGSTVWMTKASATDRVGLFTTAPGAVLDVNSGAGNMIADGYDTHSLAKYKEGIAAASGYLSKLAAVPAQTWTKKPFVSADSIKEATIEEFGKDAWEVYFPYDASHKNKALQNMEAGEMKTWIDAWAETQRVEFRKELRWRKKNVGLVADATATLTNLPEVVSTDLEGNPTGIDTLSYVGVLHSALVELSKKVDAL